MIVNVWNKSGKGKTESTSAEVCRPCPCGCDRREYGRELRGYIKIEPSGRSQKGQTIPIYSEETMKALEAEFGKAKFEGED